MLVDESGGNLPYHHVKSTTSNKNTKLHDLQAKETNQQNPPSFILVSEFSLSGILAVPEAAAAARGGLHVLWELLEHPKWLGRGWPLLGENTLQAFG